MALTPMERLVDQACGATGTPDKDLDTERARREAALRAKDMNAVAEGVAIDLLYHIDTLYPAMWDGVAKAARPAPACAIPSSSPWGSA